MQTLVGKILVGEVATGYLEGQRSKWRATWFVHHSPSGNGRDWEVLDHGDVPGPFESRQQALAEAHKVGVDHARIRQGDMDIPEQDWRAPFPSLT
jgi:hypothetical protein